MDIMDLRHSVGGDECDDVGVKVIIFVGDFRFYLAMRFLKHKRRTFSS